MQSIYKIMNKIAKYSTLLIICLSLATNLLADKGFWLPAFVPDSIQEYIEE